MTAATNATPMVSGMTGKLQNTFSSQSSFIMQLEENPELPYPEVKKMRQAIQKDVELLRNRVRMLQIEE
jgi:hypothetical protein